MEFSINVLFLIVWLSYVNYCFSVASPPLTCRDLNGKPVEWFTSYKLPRIKEHSEWPHVRTGAALVYQDANSPGKWQRAETLITDEASYVADTISSLYQPKKEHLTYVLYNDQPPPNRKSFMDKGHAKGVIIFNGESGIWLVHSIPGFPPPTTDSRYSYPESGHIFGQSIMCLSMSASQLDSIANQLYYNNVHVYDKNVPQLVLDQVPHLRLLFQRSRPPPWPYKSTLTLVGNNGTQFVSFAKDGRFEEDLYDHDVAPYLQTNLSVEAWRNGNGNIPSDCNGSYSVMNVNAIHFDVPSDLDCDVKFETNNDHSKWAVSASHHAPWSCIGDINRQVGQFRRGGGTVCFRNPKVWQSYSDLISGIDACSLKPSKPKKAKKPHKKHRKKVRPGADGDWIPATASKGKKHRSEPGLRILYN